MSIKEVFVQVSQIHVLPPLLANQIAAGEVVERPASVLKELMENAIDAGAKNVHVVLDAGGTRSLQVQDDGFGISKDDLALALQRHATSKIHEIGDLSHIVSLGFRGEALASIASVSRLTLTSRPETQEEAWQVSVEGSQQAAKLQPAAHPKGSTVLMRDLFFNTPARRHFLRSEKTEYLYCEEVFKRLALSHFDVGFYLTHNARVIYQLSPTEDEKQREKRIGKICGQAFIEHSHALNQQRPPLQLSGWVGSPSFHRSQTDMQYFFVNQRIIRDKVINHAIREAFEDQLPAGRYPCYVLYLSIPPDTVDVNVHPTKHEVRFRNSRDVHDFLVSTLLQTLSSNHSAVHHIEPLAPRQPPVLPELTKPSPSVSPPSLVKTKALQDKLMPFMVSPLSREIVTAPAKTSAEHSQSLATDSKNEDYVGETKQDTQCSSVYSFVAFLHERYQIVQSPNGLCCVDLFAAQRFLLALDWIAQIEGGRVVQQPLLVPKVFNPEPPAGELLSSAQKFIEMLGFSIVGNEDGEVHVRQIPALIAHLPLSPFIYGLFDCLADSSEHTARALVDILTSSAQFDVKRLDGRQQQAITDALAHAGLFEADDAYFIYHLSLEDLAAFTEKKAKSPAKGKVLEAV